MRLTAVMWPRRCSIGRRVDDQQVGAMNLMVPLNCEDPVGVGLARDKGIAICLRYLGGLIAGKPSSHRDCISIQACRIQKKLNPT